MKITLLILGSLMILFSFLPLIRTHKWWVRIMDFPRVQIAVIGSIVLAAYIWAVGLNTTTDYVFSGLLLVAVLNELIRFIPFTPLYPKEALHTKLNPPRHTISIMISNVRMANKNYGKYLEVVHKSNPDILIINEPNHEWCQQIKELDKKYAYSVKKPQENTYGMMVLSKLKIAASEIRFLVEKGIPSFYVLLELPDGRRFDLYTVHPKPPRLMGDTEEREAELITVAKQLKKTKYPSIVAGDLNDVAWSHTTRLFRRISGLLDPRIGRGFYNTYNAHVPFFRYSLDHIFYDRVFRLVQLKRLGYIGSDHFPILITLSFEPQGAKEHGPPKADREDKEEAQEMLEDEAEKKQEKQQKEKK